MPVYSQPGVSRPDYPYGAQPLSPQWNSMGSATDRDTGSFRRNFYFPARGHLRDDPMIRSFGMS